MPEQEQAAFWYDLFEDYFGVPVQDTLRWEQELKRIRPNVSNEDLCTVIRVKSRTIFDLKRKATLRDLSDWLRSAEGLEMDPVRPETGCTLCYKGWLSFGHGRDGNVVVWQSDGFNSANCPCTCAQGREHLDNMIHTKQATESKIKALQDQVLEAMKDPQEYVLPDLPERPRCSDGPAKGIGTVINETLGGKGKAPF